MPLLLDSAKLDKKSLVYLAMMAAAAVGSLSLIYLFFFLSSSEVFGQGPAPDHINSVVILNPKADIDLTGKTINVGFSAKNSSSNYYSDLTWKFSILKGGIIKLDPAKKNQQITVTPSIMVEDIVSDETFSLAPGEEKSFEYKYNLENLSIPPGSDYSLRIKVVSRNDQHEYGSWLKPGVTLGNGFIPIFVEDMVLVYRGQKQIGQALTGINVARGDSLGVQVKLKNGWKAPVEIQALVKTFSRLETLKMVDEFRTDFSSIAPGGSVDLYIPLPNRKDIPPDSYLSTLRFYTKDGKSVSPLMAFRWVAIGVTGKIIRVSSQKDFYKAGEPLDVKAEVVGPADFVTSATLTLRLALYNERGEKKAGFEKSAKFTGSTDSKIFDFSEEKSPQDILLSKIGLELLNGEELLDTFDLHFEKRSPAAEEFIKSKSRYNAFYFLAVILAAVMAALLFLKKRKLFPPTAAFFFVLISVLAIWSGVGSDINYALAGDCDHFDGVHDDCPTGFGTYLKNQCSLGCGDDTCLAGVDINTPPALSLLSNTQIRLTARASVMKCWNSANVDYDLSYSYCGESANSRSIRINYRSGGTEWGNCGHSGTCYFDTDYTIYSGGPTYQQMREYNIQISCSDGRATVGVTSFPTEVTNYSACNRSPSANAGSGHSIPVNTSHTHSGASASDPDGNLSSYSWSWVSCPGTCPGLSGASGSISGSSASISGPTYTPPIAGNYTLKLTVKDSLGASASSNVTETAETAETANLSPSANNLQVNQPNYCTSGPTGFYSWQFIDPDAGDTQSAYQVQVDNNAAFISPEDDSGKVFSSSQSYATPLGKLSYNTTYYWRVMVWDSKGAPSSWISGPSFTTPLHAYPNVDFSWITLNPPADAIAQFTDQSGCFDSDNQCNSWAWTFQDGNPASSSQKNATTTFSSSGQKIVNLIVTDGEGYSCQKQKTVNASTRLPRWKEIAPSP
jgi:hypothetical protein